MRDYISPATQHGSVTVGGVQGQALPLRPEDPQVGSLEAERQTLDSAGLSEDVIGTALMCTRPTLQWAYDGQWQAFVGCVMNRVSILFMQM